MIYILSAEMSQECVSRPWSQLFEELSLFSKFTTLSLGLHLLVLCSHKLMAESMKLL